MCLSYFILLSMITRIGVALLYTLVLILANPPPPGTHVLFTCHSVHQTIKYLACSCLNLLPYAPCSGESLSDLGITNASIHFDLCAGTTSNRSTRRLSQFRASSLRITCAAILHCDFLWVQQDDIPRPNSSPGKDRNSNGDGRGLSQQQRLQPSIGRWLFRVDQQTQW